MTPEQSDDLEYVLDRFEARVRRKWSFAEQRLQQTHRARLLKAAELDEPESGIGSFVCPSDDAQTFDTSIAGPSWRVRRRRFQS